MHRALAWTYIGHDVSIPALLSHTILFLAVSSTRFKVRLAVRLPTQLEACIPSPACFTLTEEEPFGKARCRWIWVNALGSNVLHSLVGNPYTGCHTAL